MHLVIDMWYQTSIFWDAVRRRLVVGHRIVKQPIPPTLQGSNSPPLAVPKRRWTNTNLRRTTRTGPTHVGAPGRLIIRRPFQPIFFKLFRPRKGLANSPEGACPNCGIFSDKLFRAWEPQLSTPLFQWRLSAPKGWRPGQLPSWLTLQSGRVRNFPKGRKPQIR